MTLTNLTISRSPFFILSRKELSIRLYFAVILTYLHVIHSFNLQNLYIRFILPQHCPFNIRTVIQNRLGGQQKMKNFKLLATIGLASSIFLAACNGNTGSTGNSDNGDNSSSDKNTPALSGDIAGDGSSTVAPIYGSTC